MHFSLGPLVAGTRECRAIALLCNLFRLLHQGRGNLGICHERDMLVIFVLRVIGPKSELFGAGTSTGQFLESIAGDHQVA